MEIVYALLLGTVIGGALALAALALLLFILKRSDANAAAAIAAGEDAAAVNRPTLNTVLKFHVSKYLVDVLLLLGLFLARDLLPFRWEFVLLAVAMMMTIFFQLLLAFTGVNKRMGKR